MRNLRKYLGVLAAAVSLGAIAAPVHAACPLITVRENGHGTLDFSQCGGGVTVLRGVLAADPGPGGLGSVLTYDLLGPPSLTSGDVLMRDDGGQIFDVVRFNNYNAGGVQGYRASLLFYSDNVPTSDSIADTPSPPGSLYSNVVTINEIGSETWNGAEYRPTPGEPGYVPGFSVTYNLLSDAVATPEPATWMMLILGLGSVGAAARSQRRRTLPAG